MPERCLSAAIAPCHSIALSRHRPSVFTGTTSPAAASGRSNLEAPRSFLRPSASQVVLDVRPRDLGTLRPSSRCFLSKGEERMRWRTLQSLFWAGTTFLLMVTVADAEGD